MGPAGRGAKSDRCRKNTVALSYGRVCSPHSKQCCSELMLHLPGEGPQLRCPELCLICWAPSSLMGCAAQLLKFFSSLAVTFCGLFCVPLGCSSPLCCGRPGESRCFSRKHICRFVGCGTRAVVRFTTGPAPLVGLGGFYTPCNMFALQRQNPGNGLNLPSREKQQTDRLL